MGTDCCGGGGNSVALACPSCGAKGALVSITTLEALGRNIAPIPADRWRFCGSPGCPVVWYGEASGTRLDAAACRVRIGSKEAALDRPVCYCFGFSAEGVEVRAVTSAPVSSEVRDRCGRGEDHCETTNPRGSCCLGDVRRIEKATTAVSKPVPVGTTEPK